MTSNSELVREAMTALFINGDVTAVERFWAPDYIQHNPQLPDGRDGLAAAMGEMSSNDKYETGAIAS